MPKSVPDSTCGLTHVAIAVRDPQRSLKFYAAVVGAKAVYEDRNFVQAQTPESRDVLVFERVPARAGKIGGVAQFGFRLKRAADIAVAAAYGMLAYLTNSIWPSVVMHAGGNMFTSMDLIVRGNSEWQASKSPAPLIWETALTSPSGASWRHSS